MSGRDRPARPAAGTPEDTRAGLCGSCRLARRIESGRGSVFFLCERSVTDPDYPRYPRLPRLACPGYERGSRGRTGPVD